MTGRHRWWCRDAEQAAVENSGYHSSSVTSSSLSRPRVKMPAGRLDAERHSVGSIIPTPSHAG